MKKYLLVYYGGKMETDPKKVKASTDAWMKWFKDMGAAVVEAGNPTAPGAMVTAKGVKKGAPKDPVTGYSIIQADDLDKAAEWAKKSPQISAEGQIAVYEIMPTM
jgi:hypothetical protein